MSTSRQSPEQPGGEKRVVHVERAGNGTGRTATVRNPALGTWRVVALLAVLALGGCATATTQNTTASHPSAPPKAPASAPAPEPPPPPRPRPAITPPKPASDCIAHTRYCGQAAKTYSAARAECQGGPQAVAGTSDPTAAARKVSGDFRPELRSVAVDGCLAALHRGAP